jgi:hypothetical protein
VKLKSFCVIGGTGGTSPGKVKLCVPEFFSNICIRFINRDDIDFDNVREMKPVQTIEMAENVNGEIEWPVQYVLNFSAALKLILKGCTALGMFTV